MIAIYLTTENMTAELHAEGRRRLKEAGAPEDAMKLHSPTRYPSTSTLACCFPLPLAALSTSLWPILSLN